MARPERLETSWPAGTGSTAPEDNLAVARPRRGGEERHDRGADPWPAEGPESPSSFERVPPQDIDAEQSVLGGMLLSKDAIADVIEVLKGQDFYRPAHETIFQTILDLYARGEPADPITVAAELTRRGELGRVGGPSYLHSLVQSVPTAANAEYYAEIVRERAVLRRLVTAGTRIAQMGYAADGDVDEIVNSAQAEIFAVTEQRTSEDYLPLAEIMEGALDEIEAIGSRSGQMSGVPTGFTDLDALTNGLHPGQMIVIAARPAMGKALALDTPLPTPDGWTTMGEVRVGDHLLGADGRPTRVVAATEVLTGRPCYELTFDDGTTVVADAEHQWPTDTGVRTTRQLAAETGCPAPAGPPPTVPPTAPLDLPARTLPVPPYTLGAWLAGGHGAQARITVADPETLTYLKADGWDVSQVEGAPLTYALDAPLPPEPDRAAAGATGAPTRAAPTAGGDGLRDRLRRLGVLGSPHIPVAYLRASLPQRRALLAGLLDVGGTVTPAGTVVLPDLPEQLAADVRDLVAGLGYRRPPQPPAQPGSAPAAGAAGPGKGPGTDGGHTVAFATTDEVFRVSGKRRRHAACRPAADHGATRPGRCLTRVRRVDSVPVRCVQVDHPAHLYLATRAMVPTHNSTLALDFARAASVKHGLPSVIFSLEMGRNEIAMRLLSAEARVALHHMRSGTMTDDDWTRLARQMPAVTEAPLYIDDSPNLSMMEIRAKCRRLKQRNDLQLIVIDYLQLMQTGGSRRPESRQQEVSEMSRNLKLLAKELEVPVVALSQLNRGPEQRTDKKPMISDLRESGSIEQDADVVILLHREDAYEKESPRAGEADLIVAKHRNGPTATITVAFQGHYSRFVNMAGDV